MGDTYYIPTELNNSNYRYFLSPNNYILVYTNNNCFTNMNRTTCDCYRVDYNHYYVSKSYQCSISNTEFELNYNQLTTNKYYRNDFANIAMTVFVLAIMLLYFPFRLFSRLFGRWLKW